MPTPEFTELIRRNAKLIHKIASAYCREAADHEDVVQEIAVQLWRSRARYDGPVTRLQRDIERIQFAEYRSFKWALLGGVLFWLPALLLPFEALTGVDALARVHLPYLLGNLVVGLLVLALGQLWSRKYVERSELSPWARRLVDALSGRSLRTMSSRLAELARFERE